jgi:3-deoxy-manno-octulosonate cytidylyltransferase (CMP-KDO synthetase)
MQIIGVIPARYDSTRFPGKPLALIKGKSLIERVWRQARKARKLDDIIIATDDDRIQKAAEAFGARVVLTSRTCKCGTDRLAEVARKTPASAGIFINIQGDEPLIPPALIDELAETLRATPGLPAVTAAYPLNDEREYMDPNVVKVVVDEKSHALFFSRSPLPYRRSKGTMTCYKHLGIYGYRRHFLLRFTGWPQTPLEKIEQLEQLRILEKGYRIKVVLSGRDSYGVDVPDDVKKIERLLK